MQRTTETLIANLDSKQEAAITKIKQELKSIFSAIKDTEDKKLPDRVVTSH